MEEVSQDKFIEITDKIGYSTSFILGEKDTIRYNGKKGLFKGSCFAKTVKDKYFVDEFFLKK